MRSAGMYLCVPSPRPSGTPKRPCTPTPGRRMAAQVAYDPQDSDGVQRIYVVPADGGMPTQITSTESSFVQWSPDGSMIAYYGIEGSDAEHDRHERVSVIRASGSAPPVLGPALGEGSALTWAPDAQARHPA